MWPNQTHKKHLLETVAKNNKQKNKNKNKKIKTKTKKY